MSKICFLDRDGILNVDHGYTYRVSEFRAVPGIIPLLSALSASGFSFIIITNQSGIGRGFYTTSDYQIFMDCLYRYFLSFGISFLGDFFCPHSPCQPTPCTCRKPRYGLLESAAMRYRFDKSRSILIGDKVSDVICGADYGLGRNYLVTASAGEIPFIPTIYHYPSLSSLALSLGTKRRPSQSVTTNEFVRHSPT
jgi:D-glycero-D-manno-heptose 1,7-bisphosphate phosphatase